MAHYIALDIAYDKPETLESVLDELTAGMVGVSTEVVCERGPAGGAPIVHFIGTRPQLGVVIARYVGDSGDSVDFYLEMINKLPKPRD